MSKNDSRRIQKEIRDMANSQDMNISATPDERNIYKWNAVIKGPSDTPYHDGVYKLDISLPNDYPFQPPKIIFRTKIYHCNISNKGEICLDILKDGWTPALTIEKTLYSLIALLEHPNPEDPLEPMIAREMVSRPETFNKKARDMTLHYAIQQEIRKEKKRKFVEEDEEEEEE
jgi:ubiquitin-protein ligase